MYRSVASRDSWACQSGFSTNQSALSSLLWKNPRLFSQASMQGKLWAYSGFFLSGSLSSHSSPVPESSASSEGLEQSSGLLGREDEVRGRGRGGNLVKIKGETVENLDNEEDDEAIADNALSLVMKLGGLLMAAIFPVYFFCSVTVVESPHVIEEEDMEMKIGFLRRRFATLHRHVLSFALTWCERYFLHCSVLPPKPFSDGNIFFNTIYNYFLSILKQ